MENNVHKLPRCVHDEVKSVSVHVRAPPVARTNVAAGSIAPRGRSLPVRLDPNFSFPAHGGGRWSGGCDACVQGFYGGVTCRAAGVAPLWYRSVGTT